MEGSSIAIRTSNAGCSVLISHQPYSVTGLFLVHVLIQRGTTRAYILWPHVNLTSCTHHLLKISISEILPNIKQPNNIRKQQSDWYHKALSVKLVIWIMQQFNIQNFHFSASTTMPLITRNLWTFSFFCIISFGDVFRMEAAITDQY